ncbi:MAG: HAD-IIIA family hydrolase [Bacteroidetes bacterium]|nr:HAD-IIIA family hydrolase [Bacteroidota bacterium]
MSILPVQSILPEVLGSIQHLSPEKFQRRARRIRLLLTDNDGVLTDTGVYYGPEGEAVKRYSIRDGMGMERLRVLGVETGIITGEKSLNLKRRAEKLKLKHLYLGVKDKSTALVRIRQETGYSNDEIAYIGDDVNDLGIMDVVGEHGLTAVPADAMPQVRAMAHYICAWRGGNGAFRDFAEALITLRLNNTM